jgi:hypothetical protein
MGGTMDEQAFDNLQHDATKASTVEGLGFKFVGIVNENRPMPERKEVT